MPSILLSNIAHDGCLSAAQGNTIVAQFVPTRTYATCIRPTIWLFFPVGLSVGRLRVYGRVIVKKEPTSATPAWLQHARDHWSNRGATRPDFALPTGPGQESVWDYPRPPALVPDERLVEVRQGDRLIASTTESVRILETSHPPSFYVPGDCIAEGALQPVPGNSHCEWKGQAEYLALSPIAGATVGPAVGWRYPTPYPEFAPWAGYVSFYPYAVECFVDGETVIPQEGGFYGGWITAEIIGPFKGSTGSSGW